MAFVSDKHANNYAYINIKIYYRYYMPL